MGTKGTKDSARSAGDCGYTEKEIHEISVGKDQIVDIRIAIISTPKVGPGPVKREIQLLVKE